MFASDLRALLASGLVPARHRPPAVARYLSYAYLPGRDTLLSGVQGAARRGAPVPRRRAVVHAPLVASRRAGRDRRADEDELRRATARRLEAAVRRRLPPSGPVGAFLSGGIDSSLVVALARGCIDERSTRTRSRSGGLPQRAAVQLAGRGALRDRHHVVELSPGDAAPSRRLDRDARRSDRRPADGAQRAAVPRGRRARSASSSTARAATRASAARRTCRCCWPSCSATAPRRGDAARVRARAELPARPPEVLRRSARRCSRLTSQPSIADARWKRELAPFFADPRWPAASWPS